jgi:hypothetical protein
MEFISDPEETAGGAHPPKHYGRCSASARPAGNGERGGAGPGHRAVIVPKLRPSWGTTGFTCQISP